MTKTLILGFLAVLVGTLGCKEKKRKGGLPPATEWRAGQNNDPTSQDPGTSPNLGKMPNVPGGNPHAGLGIPSPNQMGGGGANPHAGLGIPSPDQMKGGGGSPNAPGNPHAGMGLDPKGNPVAGGASSDMRIPSRTPHPDRTLSGVLTLSAKMKSKVPANAWLFIYAKPWDKKTNKMIDSTIVVKVEHKPTFPYKFTIDESDAMTGLPLTGTVVFEARLDGDQNASSRQKGDVVGRIKVKVPNTKLKVAMDSVLKGDVSVGGM